MPGEVAEQSGSEVPAHVAARNGHLAVLEVLAESAVLAAERRTEGR